MGKVKRGKDLCSSRQRTEDKCHVSDIGYGYETRIGYVDRSRNRNRTTKRAS
jgi:hypothetical protein